MPRSVLRIKCPCCGRSLEVDTRSGKARVMRTGDAGLDDLLESQKSESDRLSSEFESAREEHERQDERLDELFRDAQEKSKDDDSKPTNPFDLD